MKFLLLASGKIAEKFILEQRFEETIKSNLVGIVASNEVVSLVGSKFDRLNKLSAFAIGEKSVNEEQIKTLIRSAKPDFILSIQYPWILSAEVLNLISGKVLNLHNAGIP